ncbi:hypothetical protein ACF1G0_01040 [Streptomyces sp. NPDC013953]|uniref:hypothetical protein n=1 Tax=Streptomyces sp. NPDC013953 TaxID=3364868 RepID=UPI0036FCC244
MDLGASARNNAAWCATMCRAHGLPGGTSGARAWTSPRRTPPYYPDAVTLAPGLSPRDVRDLLDAVDRRAPGCSVKDSFADLDLTGHGFAPLFEARWIHRPADLPPPGRPDAGEAAWQPVRTPAGLAAWEAAWSDGNTMGLFRPALLADPSTTVLAGRAPDGRIVSGAVVSHAAGVAGVSNLFGGDAAWPGCLAAIAARLPGTPVVGYEHGDDLDAALRHGFTATGPLRVWLSTETSPDDDAQAADSRERAAADT